ncbi:MAG: ATP-binding cassette domain-containing protein [Hyphomicrobiaceae bacterium]|nr:ATP-binding cassette domain-containing protein [Hyphomicrobiaceae bacterium]
MALLRVEQLTIPGLPSLSFEVGDGECLAVEGPSGTGKTRLLRAIADLDEAPGHVFLDGAERHEMPASQWRRHVRYAAAEPGWWGETARVSLLPPGSDEARVLKLVGDLGLDSALLDRPLTQLSTGERLRLALVRAMSDQPRVLLLDEPTGALDTASAALAEELIRYQVLAGRSVILVSHDPGQIERLSDLRLQLAAPRKAETREQP